VQIQHVIGMSAIFCLPPGQLVFAPEPPSWAPGLLVGMPAGTVPERRQ
jgi:hypothetical protein